MFVPSRFSHGIRTQRSVREKKLSALVQVYGVTALVGTGGFLFGYDIGIISGVIAMQSFLDVSARLEQALSAPPWKHGTE